MIRHVCGEKTLASYKKHLSANHSQYAEQLQADAAAGKDAELLSWLHDNTRNCPRCSVIIYRFAGCNSMNCKCGMAFDWQSAPRLDLPPAVKKERERAAIAAATAAAQGLIGAGSLSSAISSLRKALVDWPDSTELQALLAETESVVAESERQVAAASRHRFDEQYACASAVLDEMLLSRAQQLASTIHIGTKTRSTSEPRLGPHQRQDSVHISTKTHPTSEEVDDVTTGTVDAAEDVAAKAAAKAAAQVAEAGAAVLSRGDGGKSRH